MYIHMYMLSLLSIPTTWHLNLRSRQTLSGFPAEDVSRAVDAKPFNPIGLQGLTEAYPASMQFKV